VRPHRIIEEGNVQSRTLGEQRLGSGRNTARRIARSQFSKVPSTSRRSVANPEGKSDHLDKRELGSFKDLFPLVGEYFRSHNLRYGQAFMEVLRQVRPDLHEKIKGTKQDVTFALNASDPYFNNLLYFLKDNWNKKEE
jgi:hypothetical protein